MTAPAAKPVLIDSSAWIEVLRNGADDTLKSEVVDALHDQRAAMTEPVWLELSRGARGRTEKQRLESLRGICLWLAFDPTCWEIATAMARACSAKGANVPLGDILISACARRYRAELLANDRHFLLIDRAHPHKP